MSEPRARRGLGARPDHGVPGPLRGAWCLARAIVAAAAGLLCVAEAHAAPEPPRVAMRLEVVRGPGAEGCSGETIVRAEVARRLGADPFRDDAPRVLTIRIAREGPELMASMALRDLQGESQWAEAFGTRSGCEELLSGVVLAVVAQILSAPEQAAPPYEPSPKAEPSSAPAAPPSQAQRAVPEPPQAPSGSEKAPAPLGRLRLEAGLGATLGLGITPGAAAGMTLAVGVRRFDWSVAVEGRGLVSLAQEVRGMAISTRALTMAGVGCFRSRYLFGCGVVTAGVVRFVAREPWNVISPAEPLLGVGARLGSEWPFSNRWSAYGYAEAAWLVADAVLRRQRDGRETPSAPRWSSPPLGAAFGFGITTTY